MYWILSIFLNSGGVTAITVLRGQKQVSTIYVKCNFSKMVPVKHDLMSTKGYLCCKSGNLFFVKYSSVGIRYEQCWRPIVAREKYFRKN